MSFQIRQAASKGDGLVHRDGPVDRGGLPISIPDFKAWTALVLALGLLGWGFAPSAVGDSPKSFQRHHPVNVVEARRPNETRLVVVRRTVLDDWRERIAEAGLQDQAAPWLIPRDPKRIYVFFPQEDPGEINPSELAEILRDHAENLFQAARDEAAQGDPADAFRMLHEVLFFDPNHAEVRRILGHRRNDDGTWHMASNRLRSRVATRRQGVMGWEPKSWQLVETPHFEIASQADERATRDLANKLEHWHSVWRQVFFEFWSNGPALNRWIEGRGKTRIPNKQFRVVFFPDRESYVEQLADAIPGIDRSTGYYDSSQRTSFFYASDDSVIQSSWRHELTHQLFQESRRSTELPFADRHLWLGEGIAIYFESLQEHGRWATLGGFDARRLQYARLRRLKEQFYLPFADLKQLSQREFQQHPDVAKLYSQSAGLVHLLMEADQGQNRRALIEFLRMNYLGRTKPGTFEKIVGLASAQIDTRYPDFLEVTADEVERFMLAPNRCRELVLVGIDITPGVARRLGKCSRLNWLDLSGTDIRGDLLKPLADAQELRQLFLTGCRLDNETLSTIATLSGLVELDLGGSSLQDEMVEALVRCKTLTTLNLSGTSVTDKAVPALAQLESLRQINLTGTRISDAGIQELNRRRPELTVRRRNGE